jgi:hypothetical protein
MENLLYYLLKVSVGTTVFYGTYHFLFRKSKLFVFNRLYLTGSFLASFMIPLITFKRKIYITETYSYITAETTGITETLTYVPYTAGSIGLHQYLLIIYLSGVVFFLLKLAYAFIIAARIRKNSRIEKIEGITVYVTGDNIRAFTFFDRIVIGKNILSHPSMTAALIHEAVHSREKHFLDILVAEFLFMLQWFNPFAWLQKNAIRNNLEYRADDVVVRGFDASEYQLAMLSLAQNRVKLTLFNELNSSNLKKRIIMMKSNRNNRFSGITRLAVIPVIAILLLSLSGKKTVIIHNTDVASTIDITASQQDVSSIMNSIQDEIESVQELRRFLAENIRYPREAIELARMGHVSLFARMNTDGKIIEIMRSEPDGAFVDIDEIFIVSYQPPETEPAESDDNEILIAEGRKIINSLPVLNIPELQGTSAKFNFRFVLQPDTRK